MQISEQRLQRLAESAQILWMDIKFNVNVAFDFLKGL